MILLTVLLPMTRLTFTADLKTLKVVPFNVLTRSRQIEDPLRELTPLPRPGSPTPALSTSGFQLQPLGPPSN